MKLQLKAPHARLSPCMIQMPEMLAQRIYGLALGYEDLNDHEQLRSDPLIGVLSGKRELEEPLAGKSTLNRLELAGRAARYHKISYSADAIDQLLVDLYLESHRAAPERIVLDLDATRHPPLRASAGTLLSWLLRQLLLSAVVHLRRRSAAGCAPAAGQPGCRRRFA
jgi:Transposase DDE domain group 1